MPDRFCCDHCGWNAGADELPVHPRLGHPICPDCWADGFDASPRIMWGPLLEALCDVEPSPRTPKAFVDYTDEDWAAAERIERAKAAHEASDVRLPCTIDNAHQLGFGWMREEFKVAPKRSPRR